MRLEEFYTLDHDKQFLITFSSGIFLSDRKQDECSIRLFQVDDFYVEIVSLTVSGKVLMIKSFKDDDRLEPYLAQIDISDLMA
jgi:hypothetical protein